MLRKVLVIAGSFVLGIFGCKRESEVKTTEPQSTKIETPAWAKNANIYEVNIRQYTPEGTFKALHPHLDRLAAMGVDILWLMPVHPISESKRKGSLGSYYSVNGFREINPEYGTMRDFQELVAAARNKGMKVLIDWVPHHTGWNHPWITEHPEYYNTDSTGQIRDPINEETGEPWGWTDVAELKLENQDMRKAMISDMIFWIRDIGIDGFRVDHAHGLPDDFWNQVSDSLARLNTPIFMLAEGEDTRLRNLENFEVTYAWKFHHAMNDVAQGKRNVNIFDTLLMRDRETYTHGYHMYFTSNHDENSWAGTEMERMGDGHQAFAVLAATIDGMPLIYSGQEEPITERLEFFEKDTIAWKNYAYEDFYKTLFALKKKNTALWNGEAGGLSQRINTSDHVYAFKREKDGNKVIVILNLSGQPQTTKLNEATEEMRNVFTQKQMTITPENTLTLAPWEYIVLSNR